MIPAIVALFRQKERPALLLDFVRDYSDVRGIGSGAAMAPVTFSRASSATYFDSTGTLQTASTNTPRFDYNPTTLASQGLLIEEQRTNSIRNNTMQGAVAGTPGTVPTNWQASVFGTGNSLTTSVIGTGVENGVTYIDVRINGTSGTGARVQWYWETSASVAALTGQTWTLSHYSALVSGNWSNVTTYGLRVDEFTSAGVYITGADNSAAVFPSSGLLRTKRTSFTTTLNGGATTAFIRPSNMIYLADNSAIDFTLRIGLPQLEQGAFATSVTPTTTAAATRSADLASVNTLTPWYNATEGTLFVSSVQFVTGSAGQLVAAELGDGTLNNIMQVGTQFGLTNFQTIVNTGGVAQAAFIQTASTSLTSRAFAYKVNDFAQSVNGAAASVDTAGTVPTVTSLGVGMKTNNASQLNGYIRRITYYPRRLANAELQAITS